VKILAPPYYSQCAVFASPLSAFSFFGNHYGEILVPANSGAPGKTVVKMERERERERERIVIIMNRHFKMLN